MSDESLTPTDAMPLAGPVKAVQASSTRSIQPSSTIISNVPRSYEAEETSTTQKQLSLQIAVIVIIIVVALFIAFMLYIRAVAKRKRRVLEETRRRISETVVTAGSTKSAFSSARSSLEILSRKDAESALKPHRIGRAKKVRAVDDKELKTFMCTGPLVMQAALTGEIKHALQNSPSRSLQEPVTFHPSMNEIAIIGTEFDRIVVRPSSEETEVKMKKKILKDKKKKVKSLDECVTQPSISITQKWFPITEDQTADSAEKTTAAVRKKASVKQIFPRIESEDKLQKDESGSRHSPETPNFAKLIDIVNATHMANVTSKSPSEAEGKKPVIPSEYRKEGIAKKGIETPATEQTPVVKADAARTVKAKEEEQHFKTAREVSVSLKEEKKKRKPVQVHSTQYDDEEESTHSSNDLRIEETFDDSN